MSAEGAKTASFVPEPGMLDSAADLTPVAPELPHLDEEADAAAESVDVTTDEPTPPPAAPKPAEAPTPPAAAVRHPVAAPRRAAPAIKSPPPPAARSRPRAGRWTSKEGCSPTRTGKAGGVREEQRHRHDDAAPAAARPRGDAAPAAHAAPGWPRPRRHAGGSRHDSGRRAVRRPARATATARARGRPDDRVLGGRRRRGASRSGAAVRVAVLLILLLAIVGIVYLQRSRENARVPEAVRVRVLSPKPAAVYRWFPGPGTVTDHEARTLAFESAGTLAELLPPGTAFAAGDILGKLRGAQPIEALRRPAARAGGVLSADARQHARREQPARAAPGRDQAGRQAAAGRRDDGQPGQAGGARERAGRDGRDAGQGRHAGARERAR